MARLRLSDFVIPGNAGHFARTRLEPTASLRAHTHDFTELFWIDSGAGEQVLPGRGGSMALATGWLQLVLPDDPHAFAATIGSHLVIANLAVESARWQEIAGRYLPGDTFAGDDPRRRGRQLDADGLRALRAAAAPLDAGRRDPLAVDRALLAMLDLLRAPARPEPPEWLARAVEQVRARRLFAGTGALVALCGRSREHVARACRAHLGRTPTVLINELRMAWAAERLATTAEPIPLVAEACGLGNLGHFYRLFQAAHGTSPAAWRKQRLRLFGGG